MVETEPYSLASPPGSVGRQLTVIIRQPENKTAGAIFHVGNVTYGHRGVLA